MAGLVPAIHILDPTQTRKTWVPGTSPAMTRRGQKEGPPN
jgi:hypothetical protein